jgi:hypothetical protein
MRRAERAYSFAAGPGDTPADQAIEVFLEARVRYCRFTAGIAHTRLVLPFFR